MGRARVDSVRARPSCASFASHTRTCFGVSRTKSYFCLIMSTPRLHRHIRTYIHTRRHTHTRTHIRTHTMYMHARTYIHTYIHTETCTHVDMHTHTHTHTHLLMHTHMYQSHLTHISVRHIVTRTLSSSHPQSYSHPSLLCCCFQCSITHSIQWAATIC